MKPTSRPTLAIAIAASIALIGLAAETMAQSIVIRPDRLREGDGKTRNITLEATVAAGARLSISVNYSSDPGSASVVFIPKLVVQDNGSEDRNPQEGSIRLILPKAFDKTGVYTITVDETHSTFTLIHERNNSSYFRQFVDWLVGAAGSGTRGLERKSALERIEEMIGTGEQNNVAIWTVPLPKRGQQIDPQSPKLRIRSAVMPAWSQQRNYLACSVWRNGKWIVAVHAFRQTGDATQLWQWNPPNHMSNDFSPVWAPNGDAIAFVRLNRDQQSDIWLLQLDRNYRPKREVKLTSFGNVQAVLGWDKDLGLVFETKSNAAGNASSRQVWSMTVLNESVSPRSDVYHMVRGSAPLRGTLIYAQQNDSPPASAIYEVDATNKRWTLLIGDYCTYRWPTVAHDEKWLAYESYCPR